MNLEIFRKNNNDLQKVKIASQTEKFNALEDIKMFWFREMVDSHNELINEADKLLKINQAQENKITEQAQEILELKKQVYALENRVLAEVRFNG